MAGKIYDISIPIEPGMPVYKGRPSKRPVFETVSDFESGAVYETELKLNLHSGTHIDAPLHVFPGGGTADLLDPRRMVTACRVLDLTGLVEKVSARDLREKEIAEGDFVLLKTRNSREDLLEGAFVYLDASGAAYLRDRGVSGVGIDALGIERDQPGHETHKLLLGAGIVLLEGLRLGEVGEGVYTLVAAPLCIKGAEAAPVRALLIG